jgi:recombination protein RecT
MSNEVAKTKVDLLKTVMNADSVQQQFRNALGENANSFVASVIDLYTGDVGLQQCEPKAVVMEALKAAVLKLPITKSLGFAYVVVFNNSAKDDKGNWIKVATPTFIPGYKGYIQLAMRTGQYKYLNADVVYDGELQKVNKLTGEVNFTGAKISDKVVGYFAYFELLNGFSKTLYISLEDMAKHAKRYSPTIKRKNEVTVQSLMILASQEGSTGSVGWLGNFEDMALKTCVRNLLSKYGYLSVDMVTAIDSDSKGDAASDQDGIPTTPMILNIDDAVVVEDERPNTDTPY